MSIRIVKAATDVRELLVVARFMNIEPILTESLFLGLRIGQVLANANPGASFALFDSNHLLEIVAYDDVEELRPYMKEKSFAVGYMVNLDGSGSEIE